MGRTLARRHGHGGRHSRCPGRQTSSADGSAGVDAVDHGVMDLGYIASRPSARPSTTCASHSGRCRFEQRAVPTRGQCEELTHPRSVEAGGMAHVVVEIDPSSYDHQGVPASRPAPLAASGTRLMYSFSRHRSTMVGDEIRPISPAAPRVANRRHAGMFRVIRPQKHRISRRHV